MEQATYSAQILKRRLISVDLKDEDTSKIKAHYKCEIAKIYNVCTKTCLAWIHMYFEELRPFGYIMYIRLLRLKIVRLLFKLGEPRGIHDRGLISFFVL